MQRDQTSRSAQPQSLEQVIGMPTDLSLTDQEFRLFQQIIHAETGIFLGEHKRELVRSRLSRRVRAHGLTSFQAYYDGLTSGGLGPDERAQMHNAITTNKTDFYREKAHFDFLAGEVLPALKARAARSGERRLRIWSAGCSTGEEPYTIAITLSEALGNLLTWDARILASDLDTDVLARAQAAIYPLERVQDVPEPQITRHFLRGVGAQAGQVQAGKALRDLVTFRRINLLDEPWPIRTRFDCVFCRNVLIYFDKPTQRRLVDRFADVLVEGGYLFLGHSESLYGMSRRFMVLRNTINRTRPAEGAGPRIGEEAA